MGLTFFRCPDTNKPLGLMLLNGLTKLINEYKEVKQCKTQLKLQDQTFITEINRFFLFQDPKLLCVAYSAVGKLSRYGKIIIVFIVTLVEKKGV